VACLLLAAGACGIAVPDGAAVVAPGGAGTAQAMSAGERQWALRMFDLVNQARLAADLPPLSWHEGAAEVAYAHSYDMDARNYRDHVDPDGIGPGARLEAAGIDAVTFGENIAWGYTDPESAMEGLMQSPGHRSNILYEGYTHVGIGVHTGSADGPFWTQDFLTLP
jgi:uncharacterized protein YkwD